MSMNSWAPCNVKDWGSDMLQQYQQIKPEERVIIALDMQAEEALALARQLQGEARWVKIGMTLFYKEGPSFVREFKEMGYKVFIDLKLYDIPHQVEGAIGSLVSVGADMLTMHASGGIEMMQAAQKAVEQAACGNDIPLTLGVTVLTSMDDDTLTEIGINNTAAEQVNLLAKLAKEAHLSGVVASPWEVQQLRDLLGDSAAIVTPGIRPAGGEAGDQKRIATPTFAVSHGASHLVIGRPITQAANPQAAFRSIIDELKSASV